MDKNKRNALLMKLISIHELSQKGHTEKAQEETLRVIMHLIMEVYELNKNL
jgi:hypothetical protein